VPDEVVGLAIGRSDRRLYALGFFDGQLYAIDAGTMKIERRLAIGGTPAGIAVTPDGATLVITKRDANEVALVDSEDLRIEATIPVGNRPYGVIVDAKGQRAYTANVYSDDVSVVDLATRKLIGTVKTGKRPYVVALAGGKGFVTDQYEGKVAVFDTATLAPLGRISVGDYPDGIEANCDQKKVYVINWESDSVSEIDVDTLKVTATIDVGDSPRSFGTFIRKAP
jgi:YVTN family beta-propeller protein